MEGYHCTTCSAHRVRGLSRLGNVELPAAGIVCARHDRGPRTRRPGLCGMPDLDTAAVAIAVTPAALGALCIAAGLAGLDRLAGPLQRQHQRAQRTEGRTVLHLRLHHRSERRDPPHARRSRWEELALG